MFKIILLIIVIFMLFNLKLIIDKKRKYFLSKNNKALNKKSITQYGSYLKIIDGFITFLVMLMSFNIYLMRFKEAYLYNYYIN